ncbi:aldo/keto reductase [Desulfogranum japonicum]|uniref:aldo/keto reductase n=1 Tax=Desulfogranum japonicum TaxID=231447 RepID=UPI0004015DFB|nr:aldo/keto reductase [Desulfogranum japonicum]
MVNTISTVALGNSSITLSRQGLGCMGLSEFYGEPVQKAEGIRLIHHALDLGVTFFDTADMYGNGHNEQLLASALKGKREQATIATKFGIVREGANYARKINGSPEYVRKACHESLRRLETDYIDLYYIHRIDADTPIEDTVGEMARLVDEGKIRAIGICEASAQTIQRAHQEHPLSAVQSEYSMFTRDPEQDILQITRDFNITFVAYSPICRGLLSSSTVKNNDPKDVRAFFPRFQSDAYDNNQQIAHELSKIAEDKHCSLAQLSLAWVMAQGRHIVPIPGTTKIKNLESNTAANQLVLTETDLLHINKILDSSIVSGARYTVEGMKGVNI